MGSCRGVACNGAKSAPTRALRVSCSAGARESLIAGVRSTALGLAAAATVIMPTLVPVAEAFESNQAYGEMARLTAGDPVKNPYALLRNALPISNKEIRVVQLALESISEDLRVPGVRFSGVSKSVNTAFKVVDRKGEQILASVAPSKKEQGAALLAQLKSGLEEFVVIVENKDKQQVPIKQQEVLNIVGQLEECMVDGFPFEVPAEYSKMPLLKGRATVELNVKYVDNPRVKKATLTLVVDGLNAPVTAGNFVDLVQRKFYDGLVIDRSDGFVVQMGDPEGPEVGFVDPSTNKLRTIPLEVYVPGDKIPVYGETLEELGRSNETPALPFNAYGTMAMARSEFDSNSGSSQIFFLLKESELTPSGANLLDGRYAVFGYVIENVDALGELKVGDIVESARVVSGLEFLENPSTSRRPAATTDALLTASDA